jgi:hypothetical protein
MKKAISLLFICIATGLSAQQEKEAGPNAKQNENSAIKSIERALNEIDSTLSSVVVKIDNTIADTTNFVKLRKSLERINQNFLSASQKIDKKMTEILPDIDDKGKKN